MFSDDELYSRFLSGDTAAFDELILKYSSRLILYLNGLVCNMHDAEDMSVETFAVILAKRPLIRSGCFQAYLFRAARNRAVRFRLIRRKVQVFDPSDDRLEEALTAHPEDEFIRDERRRAVQRCLERIAPESREALWLIYYENMSYAQASAVLGVNPKKIDNLLVRGKRLMKAELSMEGITDAFG